MRFLQVLNVSFDLSFLNLLDLRLHVVNFISNVLRFLIGIVTRINDEGETCNEQCDASDQKAKALYAFCFVFCSFVFRTHDVFPLFFLTDDLSIW